MLRVSNLHFRYGSEPVFAGIDLYVGNGEKAGLVGQNGSGKTTLFKILSGSESPDLGKVEIGGKMAFVPQEIRNDMINPFQNSFSL